MKRYFLALVTIWVLCPVILHAQIVFSEIMYDASGTDAGHEWVEIQNTGTSSVDLTGWKFNDGANHTLNAPPANGSVGSMTLSAGGYMILSGDATQFLADHSGYTGTVIDTVMSLNNSGDTITLIGADGVTADTVTYQSSLGGGGDGNSLQKIASAWVPATPTPGVENSSVNISTDSSGSSTTSTTDQKTQKSDFIPPTYDMEIITQTTSLAGVPVEFSTLVRDQKKNEISGGVYEWSFGDGTSTIVQNNNGKIAHSFASSGEYVVYVDYYSYRGKLEPDDTDRVTVHIVDPLVQGSVASDGSYRIMSQAKTELDLGGWTITTDGAVVYTIPKHTIILPGKTLVLSAVIFTKPLTMGSYLTTSSGVVLGKQKEYSSHVASSRVSAQSSTKYSATKNPVAVSTNSALMATASESIDTNGSSVTTSRTLIILGLIIVLTGISGVGVWYIRRLRVRNTQGKNDTAPVVDEFELVE